MKFFYRGVLVVPTVLPSVWQAHSDKWNDSKPILIVVIPCHNYGRYIRETLRSLQGQTFRDFETIVVDDGSNEELTLRILNDLRNEGFEVLRQKKLNVAATLNLGISATSGRYICCLAADDTIEPTYFEKCLCLLESNPGVSVAYSLVRTFGDENQIWPSEPFDLRLLLEYNYMCGTAVFRRSAWEAVGGFDQGMNGYEDWEFWIKLGKNGFRGRIIPEALLNYRRHGITLNLRADTRSQRLLAHIRANHAGLYSHPEKIRDIQKAYYDIRMPLPFINLSSKNQYGHSERQTGVIIASANGIAIADRILRQFSSTTKLENRPHFILVSTDYTSHEHDEHLPRTFSNQVYHLARFLDPYCWLDFVINLIETRSVRLVVVSNSRIAYEWTRTLKSRTSAVIVAVIEDPVECHLSAKYDQFIDFHVTVSEQANESLVKDFGISPKKIYSLSKPTSFDDTRNDLLRSLVALG